jgi:hypothetical protein
MAATQAELREWFDRHKELGYDYMLVYVDEFDWDDYPVGVFTQGYWEKRRELNAETMQRFMESYDLHANRDEQLRVFRVDRFPVEQPLHGPEIPVRVKTTKGEHHMVREEVYKKNGIKPTDNNRFVKLLEGFDARLDALNARAETIEHQLEPLYKAIVLNSPDLRDELAKRVLEYVGTHKDHGMPPTPAQQSMDAPISPGGPVRSDTATVLAFNCRMCTNLTNDAKRVKIDGHHDIFACPRCAGKLSDIVSTLLS